MKFLLTLGILSALFTVGTAARADDEAKAKRVERVFARLDANHDGKISREEAEKGPRLAKHFDAVDADKDGFITPAELLAFFKSHHRRQ